METPSRRRIVSDRSSIVAREAHDWRLADEAEIKLAIVWFKQAVLAAAHQAQASELADLRAAQQRRFDTLTAQNAGFRGRKHFDRFLEDQLRSSFRKASA